LRQELANAALHRVCERYDWSVIVPRLLRVYQEMGVG
jgi:hypothetical protein